MHFNITFYVYFLKNAKNFQKWLKFRRKKNLNLRKIMGSALKICSKLHKNSLLMFPISDPIIADCNWHIFVTLIHPKLHNFNFGPNNKKNRSHRGSDLFFYWFGPKLWAELIGPKNKKNSADNFYVSKFEWHLWIHSNSESKSKQVVFIVSNAESF